MDSKRLLKLSILISTLALFVFIFTYLNSSLNKPVLIKKYIEAPISDSTTSFVYYNEFLLLRNEMDNSTILSEYMVEENLKNPMVYEENFSTNKGFIYDEYSENKNRYKINYLNYKIEPVLKPGENLSFSKIDYVNQDGSSGEFDIGKIIYFEDINSTSYSPIKERYTDGGISSSSGGEINTSSREYFFDAAEDLELIEIESDLIDLFDKNFDMKINNVDYKNIKGMKIPKGGQIHIKTTFELDLNKEEVDYNVVNIVGRLVFKDKTKNHYKKEIPLIFELLNPSDLEFDYIVSAKKEG